MNRMNHINEKSILLCVLFCIIAFPIEYLYYEGHSSIHLRSIWIKHCYSFPFLTALYKYSSFSYFAVTFGTDILFLKISLSIQSVLSFYSDYQNAFKKSIWKPIDRTLALFHVFYLCWYLNLLLVSPVSPLVSPINTLFISVGTLAFILEKYYKNKQCMTGVQICICMWHYLVPLGGYSYLTRYTQNNLVKN